MAPTGSSRIIVKNLPKHLTVDRFRQHFESKGLVTDAKIMHTKSGRSRLFGFVGYQSESDAKAAVEYFNDTFIDTSKIAVELAKSFGDPDLPRAWSKYSANTRLQQQSSADSSDEAKSKEKEKAAKIKQQFHGILSELEQDPKLKEFIEVMKPRSQAKTWMNDDGLGGSTGNADMPAAEAAMPSFTAQPGSDDDLYEDLPGVSAKPQQAGSERRERKTAEPLESPSVETAQDKEEAVEEQVKDEAAEIIRDTGRLFVRNLPFNCTDSDLSNLFSKYGPVSEVQINYYGL
jgi:multiple RNA-binding domain-containing protein 1